MNIYLILEKLKYHTSINSVNNKTNLDIFMEKAGFKKPEEKSPRQLDMIKYYTSIEQPSLMDRIKEIQ